MENLIMQAIAEPMKLLAITVATGIALFIAYLIGTDDCKCSDLAAFITVPLMFAFISLAAMSVAIFGNKLADELKAEQQEMDKKIQEQYAPELDSLKELSSMPEVQALYK